MNYLEDINGFFFHCLPHLYVLGSSVGLVTGYGLEGPGIETSTRYHLTVVTTMPEGTGL